MTNKKAKTTKEKSASEVPEKRQTGKKEPYAYTITDKAFGELKVLNSANAWWLDRAKVQNLINAYKIDANDDEACAYAGISFDQLKYFKRLHADFSLVKHACRQILGLKAKQALANKVMENPEWYLERRRKDEYSTRQENTGADGRDLFDGMTERYRQLTDQVGTMEDDEEHPSDNDTGHPDAGSDGAGDETSAATDRQDASVPSA